MTDTVKARRPAKKPDGASSAPHAPAPHDTAPDAASPAWAQASVAAPFALGVPVQRKPVIGRANDAYEREADAVADRVAGRNVVSAPLPISRVSAGALAPPVQTKSIGDRTEHDDPPQPNASGPGIIQRTPAVVQRAEDEQPAEDSGAVQTMPAASAFVQRAEDDQEPDEAAGAVQTKPATSAVVQRTEDDEEPDEDSAAVQTKPAASAVVQRAEDDEEFDDDADALKAEGEPGGVAGGSPAMRSAAATAISTRDPGSPLPAATRAMLESGIGMDLRDVRVHTGPRAEDATSKLRARAFTHGRDIWLGRGESPADTKLMAHEATHVVQQEGVVRHAPRNEDEEERRSRPTPPSRRFAAPPAPAGAPTPASAPTPAAVPTATDTTRGTGAPFALAGTRPAAPPAPATAPAESTGATSATPAAAVTTALVAVTTPVAPGTVGPVAAASGAAAPGAPASDATATPAEPPGTAQAEETETGSAASAETTATGGAATSPAAAPAQSAAPAPTTAGPSPAAPAAGTAPAEAGVAKSAAGAEGATAATPVAEAGEGAAGAGAAAAEVAEVVIPPAPRAEDDPQVQAVNRRMRGVAKGQATHPPAAEAAAEAQAAAEPPANERASQAAALQVNDLSQASTTRPDPNPFLTLLRQRLAEIAPKNLDEMDRFQASGRATELRGAVSGGVAQQRDAATAELRQGAQAAPDPTRVPEAPATPLEAVEPGPAPASPGAPRAVPPPRPEEHVSLEGSRTEVDGEMAANDIDDAQLQRANDPRFSSVAESRAEVHAHAQAAPAQYRQDEGAARARAAQGNAAAETGALTGMQGTRAGEQQQVRTKQDEARAKDEAARQAVADRIEEIFGETQRAVDGKLAALDTEVNTLFDEGEARARTAMEAHVEARKEAYKDERYSGIGGPAAWTYDLFAGLPDEVSVFYTEARDQYLRDMDAVLVSVADRVELRLREAKNEVTLGKERIRTYVEGLPATLRDTGTRAQAAVQARFDELEQSVDQHREELASSLAQRYNDARQKADEKLAEMRQSDRGLVARFRDALAEVIRILREFRERISAMLAEASDAIGMIVKDPIGFLGNLIDAVRLGVNQFSDRIGEHLREGLFAWLFGALANAGIQMPSDFSLPSIFGMVLEVLGITTANLRRKVAGVIGERNLGMIERVWGVVQTLISGGLGGLWEQAQEFVGNIGDFIREAVEEWVITRIVRAAITKLVSMFNPVGAIIAAIQGIISTVQFFIERINQIMDLVQAIVQSVARIARGDIAGAADWIEQAMARAIPVMIGFLASLLGLGGISEKIRGIIQRMQARVDNAIDRVIGKIVAGVGRLFGQGNTGRPGGTQDAKGADPAAQAAVQDPADVAAAAAPDRHRPLRESFRFLGEDHTLRSMEQPDGSVHLMMASERFDHFPVVLRELQSQQVQRLRDGNRNDEAAALHAALQVLIGDAEAKGAPGGVIAQARQAYLRERNAVPQSPISLMAFDHANGTMSDALEAAWEPHFERYVAELKRLDAVYDFSGGLRNVVAVGELIADRTNNRLIRVTAVNVRVGSRFGIRAVPANVPGGTGGEFYPYTGYAATGGTGWGPVGAKPPLLSFARISPTSGGWRGTERHVVIDDVTRRLGSGSRSSETVPGIGPGRNQRGHLIADTLGGPGDFASGNIVAMHTGSNQGEMAKKLENPARRLFETDPAPSDPLRRRIVEVKSTPQNWTNPDYPDNVHVSYQQLHPTKAPLVTEDVDNT